MSPKAKVAVGRWGEEYALRCLEWEYRQRYPQGEVQPTSDGFVICRQGIDLVEAVWLNRFEDRGEGHDIRVRIGEGRAVEYFEVKSTTTEAKATIDLSGPQWGLATQEGEHFHILRVYNAGTPQARLVLIDDPVKQWKEGTIAASSLRITV